MDERSPAQEAPRSVACHVYTAARRFPFVIGKFGKSYSPYPFTVGQIVTAVASFVVLFSLRGLWAPVFGVVPFANLLIQYGIPVAAAVAIRHARLEGRAPWRSLLGFAAYGCLRLRYALEDAIDGAFCDRSAATARLLVAPDREAA